MCGGLDQPTSTKSLMTCSYDIIIYASSTFQAPVQIVVVDFLKIFFFFLKFPGLLRKPTIAYFLQQVNHYSKLPLNQKMVESAYLLCRDFTLGLHEIKWLAVYYLK